MKKILLAFTAVLFAVFVLTSSNPSLDGRALVADEGVFPKGYFAKTVGYLPGDSISVTNPTNGDHVDILVIGSLDPSEGVAILLSPEAAEKLSIKKDSNIIVKLTKRTGSADEICNGTAVLTKGEDSDKAEVISDKDSVSSSSEQLAEAETEAEAEAEAEEVAELEDEEVPPQFEEDDSVSSEQLADSVSSEQLAEAETEAEAEAVAELEDEEVPPEYEEIAESEEVVESEIEEEAEAEEEVAVELEEEEVPPEYEEVAEGEEVVEAEESEEAAEELAETVPEEILYEEEETPESEAVAVDDIPEESDETPETEYVEAEELAEAETEAEAEEWAEIEELPEESEELAELEEDVLSEYEELAEAEDIPEEVEEFAEEEPTEEETVEELAEEAEAGEELAEIEELPEEADEYEAIVLVPSDENPPAPVAETANNLVAASEEVAELEDTSAESFAPTLDNVTYLQSAAQLESEKYYVQIAVYNKAENIQQVSALYGDRYPIVAVGAGERKAVMVGPLGVDEYGIILERFKMYGFKDAFVKIGK